MNDPADSVDFDGCDGGGWFQPSTYC